MTGTCLRWTWRGDVNKVTTLGEWKYRFTGLSIGNVGLGVLSRVR